MSRSVANSQYKKHKSQLHVVSNLKVNKWSVKNNINAI